MVAPSDGGTNPGAIMAKVEVSNDELRTVRDAMRELNRLVDQLDRGESEKFVLTKNGQMRAVVMSVEQFAALRSAATPIPTGYCGAGVDSAEPIATTGATSRSLLRASRRPGDDENWILDRHEPVADRTQALD
jgi:hypothetical protein